MAASCSVISASRRQITPARGPQAHAQLGLLAGDQVVTKAAHLPIGGKAHQDVAATRLRSTHRCVPFQVAQAVVDRPFRKPLTPASAYGRHVGSGVQKCAGGDQPAGGHLAVAVDELRELEVVRSSLENPNPGIARPSRRERLRDVELVDGRPDRLRQGNRAVARPRIDIDDRLDLAGDGREAAPQSLPFVATDDNDAHSRCDRRGIGLHRELRRACAAGRWRGRRPRSSRRAHRTPRPRWLRSARCCRPGFGPAPWRRRRYRRCCR